MEEAEKRRRKMCYYRRALMCEGERNRVRATEISCSNVCLEEIREGSVEVVRMSACERNCERANRGQCSLPHAASETRLGRWTLFIIDFSVKIVMSPTFRMFPTLLLAALTVR